MILVMYCKALGTYCTHNHRDLDGVQNHIHILSSSVLGGPFQCSADTSAQSQATVTDHTG